MFIRAIKKTNSNSSKVYYAHKLMESTRTEKGPRQHTVLHLGTLELPKDKWKNLANRIEEIVYGKLRLLPAEQEIEDLAKHYAELLVEQKKAEKEEDPQLEDFQSVDLNSISSSHAKSVGPEHIGLQAMKQLGFFSLFKTLGFNQHQSNLAALSVIGRLVHPGSENELKRYAREESALDELLGTDFSHIGQNALYEISDLLLSHKEAIEKFLRNNTRDLLGLDDSIILYDLTNTHFEGDLPYVDKAKHGNSKQKRNDRPLITVGFVLDHRGFLKTSNVFEGNVGEPSTLMEMVQTLHSQSKGKNMLPVDKPTVVLDAGIASEDNLNHLVDQGFSYLVVSRSRPQEIPDQEFQEIKKGIKVNRFTSGNDVYLHCLSESKMQKEQSMLNRSKEKMEKELSYLKEGLGLKGRLKSYSKIQQRIGRLRKQYSRVSKAFDIQVHQDGDQATDITWNFDENKLSKPYDGSYYLRTNRTDLDAETLWQIYVMLTTVEDSFRCLKSELGLRPNFHSKAFRVEGHIFITILAYHLLQWIRYHLSMAEMSHRWTTIKSWLSTQRVLTTSMPRQEGGVTHIRHCTTPTLRQAEIYSALGISRMPLKQRKTTTQ